MDSVTYYPTSAKSITVQYKNVITVNGQIQTYCKMTRVTIIMNSNYQNSFRWVKVIPPCFFSGLNCNTIACSNHHHIWLWMSLSILLQFYTVYNFIYKNVALDLDHLHFLIINAYFSKCKSRMIYKRALFWRRFNLITWKLSFIRCV